MGVCAVVGGQMGSEGKGAVVAHIAKDYPIHVRVGAANAGHTLYTESARGWDKHVMQQLPCAAYANPAATLVLGAGAMITPEILMREIQHNTVWRDANGYQPLKLFIDYRAHVITPEHVEQEQQTDLAQRIGSTSTIAREGIGAAQAARVMRTGYLTADEWVMQNWPRAADPFLRLADTAQLLNDALPFNDVLLEGTQGTGLSNTTGFYPYVTSRNTTAAGLLADTGLPPSALSRCIVVFRTFPIRVAGNSGPFYPDSEEITWDQIGIDPEKERTTVTKKVRRVATFSRKQAEDAVRINGATEAALMFADYLQPTIYGKTEADGPSVQAEVGALAAHISIATGVRVRYLGTGPHSIIDCGY